MVGRSGPAPGGGVDVTDRAVSTVLDVSVCLLLVGAATLTLSTAPTAGPDPATGRAEELATTLAGSTATVTYRAGGRRRTARGTYAGLLADAARTDARDALGREAFRAAVVESTRPVLGGEGWRAQVIVAWRPYEGADAGRVVVGESPPPSADVHAATTLVPSGLGAVGPAAEAAAARDGYRGVAGVLADVLLPGATENRRQSYVRSTAVDLRARFETPSGAAAAVTAGRARVTVRTWSP